MVVNAHRLQEVHLELLAVTAQLGSQTITLALQLLLRDLQGSKLVKSLLALHDLRISVLVVSDHPVDLDLILGHHGLQFVAFGLALAPIALILKGHIHCILLVRKAVKLIVAGALRLSVGVRAVLKRRVAQAFVAVLVAALALHLEVLARDFVIKRACLLSGLPGR